MLSNTHKSLVQINAEFLSKGDIITLYNYDFDIMNLTEFEDSLEKLPKSDKVDILDFDADKDKCVLLNDIILISCGSSVCSNIFLSNHIRETSFELESREIGVNEVFGKKDIEAFKEIAIKRSNKYIGSNKIKQISFLIEFTVTYNCNNYDGEVDSKYDWKEFQY